MIVMVIIVIVIITVILIIMMLMIVAKLLKGAGHRGRNVNYFFTFFDFAQKGNILNPLTLRGSPLTNYHCLSLDRV